MPKSLMIVPDHVRSKSYIEFSPIPVNQYNKTIEEELKSGNFTKEDLLRIQRDMMVIRAFESMLAQGDFQSILQTRIRQP